ncbi:Hypothetical protein R9X50_00131700 [Acrodontium crateriforme]|uniref:Uncharacterized protein n=1 Tax=Acrodontium crateriforme TaxID=150365 RepID=A0AAQ3LYV3_9PEZI|nr:Hypothetical protein R9X50_00131700 [Acrodontium crateriforme]
MDSKNTDNSPSNLWTRRSKYAPSIPQHPPQSPILTAHASNSNSKLSLSMSKSDRSDTRENNESASGKRFGTATSSHGGKNPFNTGQLTPSAVASPTGVGASSAFGLGSGAFASFGSVGKTPKTPGATFDLANAGGEKKETSSSDKEDSKRPTARKQLSSTILKQPNTTTAPVATPSRDSSEKWPLKHAWVVYYRPPTSKHHDYEKSMKPLCRVHTAQAFWAVYSHLKRPSTLPTVSDYHFFKEGIRPVWEDEENKRGGKWTMRVKKGVADRYWEDLLLAIIGDQFAEASEEVCGAVISVRSGEDVFSLWTKNDGGRNVKIRETIKRILSLPADTNLQWRSHDDTITSRNAADQARQDKQHDKRRNTLSAEQKKAIDESME